MAYDKNRGRAAGTPSFYKTVGQKHTHGENTGEWTREQRARHEESDFKPRAANASTRPRTLSATIAAPRVPITAATMSTAAHRRAAPATVL